MNQVEMELKTLARSIKLKTVKISPTNCILRKMDIYLIASVSWS